MATCLPFSRRPDRGDVPPFSKRGLTMATCVPFFRPETSLPFRPTSPTCLPFHFVRFDHGHVPPFFRRPLSPGQRASLFGRARAIMDTSLPFCAPRQRAPLLCRRIMRRRSWTRPSLFQATPLAPLSPGQRASLFVRARAIMATCLPFLHFHSVHLRIHGPRPLPPPPPRTFS